MKNLVQIGSGSSNLDKQFQDGFTNYAQKEIKDSKLYLVEANSIHIQKLKKNWKNNNNVKIFNFAVIPDNVDEQNKEFFYAKDDAPDYQIFSSSRNFVEKHFPKSQILKKIVKCEKISNFFEKNLLFKIKFLSLDIEGMDFEVLYNLDLQKFDIENISFEHLHLSFWQKCKIVKKLIKNDYFFSGMGFDVRKSDWMFSKDTRNKMLITYLLPVTPRRIWKKFSFSSLIK